MPTGYVGSAFHLRNDGGMWAEGGLPDDLTGKARADNAFNGNGLSKKYFLVCMQYGQASADTGAGGTAVYFSLGKDADMAAVGLRRFGRADKDRTVKKA